MPLREYICRSCGKAVELLLPSSSTPDPACPSCGKKTLERQLSAFRPQVASPCSKCPSAPSSASSCGCADGCCHHHH